MRRWHLLLVAAFVATACCQTQPAPPSSCRNDTGTPATGPHTLDAADLRAAALPQVDLGPAYATYVWDSFGGFETNEDRARKSAGVEADAVTRGGRLAGYHAMYIPPPPDYSGVVSRIYTLVSLFPTAAGASSHFAALPGEARADLASVADEAKAYHFADGGSGTKLTRAYVRRERLVGTVGINREDDKDVLTEAVALARRLDARMAGVLRGDIRGFAGKPGTEVPAERLAAMTIPLAELGAPFGGWRRHPSSGFQDNDDRMTWELINGHEREAEFRELEDCGRVTGYFEMGAMPAQPPRWVITGAHLFASDRGAADYVARFGAREKATKGQTIGFGRLALGIEDVAALPAPSLGDSATASDMTLQGQHRVVVLVRRGHVVGETIVVLPDGAQAQSLAIELATKLDVRIKNILAGR